MKSRRHPMLLNNAYSLHRCVHTFRHTRYIDTLSHNRTIVLYGMGMGMGMGRAGHAVAVGAV